MDMDGYGEFSTKKSGYLWIWIRPNGVEWSGSQNFAPWRALGGTTRYVHYHEAEIHQEGSISRHMNRPYYNNSYDCDLSHYRWHVWNRRLQLEYYRRRQLQPQRQKHQHLGHQPLAAGRPCGVAMWWSGKQGLVQERWDDAQRGRQHGAICWSVGVTDQCVWPVLHAVTGYFIPLTDSHGRRVLARNGSLIEAPSRYQLDSSGGYGVLTVSPRQ